MPSAGPTPQRTEPALAAATTTAAAAAAAVGLEADWRRYIPDTALLVSGSFGGPFVIFTLTPLRNGLTLAAQDRVSTMSSLYRRCFVHGFRSGWVGGLWPSVPAIPQFCVLGPMYHLYTSFLGQQGALVCTAVTETAITYGANTRNAEVAYNQYVPRKDRLTNLTPAYKPIGPGALMHAVRNALGMCGMRVFAAPLDEHMCKVIRNPQASRMVSDFVASCLSGAISMPFNQLYNFFVTSKEARESTRLQRVALATTYLRGQYLTIAPGGSVRPSKIMLRDMGMRCLYAGTLFCIYATIERTLVENWPACFLSARISDINITNVHRSQVGSSPFPHRPCLNGFPNTFGWRRSLCSERHTAVVEIQHRGLDDRAIIDRSKIRLGSHTLPPNGALSGDYRLSTEDATDRRMNRVLRSEKDVKKIGRCCDAELKRSKRLYKRLGDLRKTMKRESSRLHYQLTPLQPRRTEGTTSSLAEFRNGDLEQYYYRSPVYEIMGRQASILNMYPYSDSLRRRYRL